MNVHLAHAKSVAAGAAKSRMLLCKIRALACLPLIPRNVPISREYCALFRASNALLHSEKTRRFGAIFRWRIGPGSRHRHSRTLQVQCWKQDTALNAV